MKHLGKQQSLPSLGAGPSGLRGRGAQRRPRGAAWRPHGPRGPGLGAVLRGCPCPGHWRPGRPWAEPRSPAGLWGAVVTALKASVRGASLRGCGTQLSPRRRVSAQGTCRAGCASVLSPGSVYAAPAARFPPDPAGGGQPLALGRPAAASAGALCCGPPLAGPDGRARRWLGAGALSRLLRAHRPRRAAALEGFSPTCLLR